MKNRRKIQFLTATTAISILSATTIYADTSCSVSDNSIKNSTEISDGTSADLDIRDIFTWPAGSGSVSYLIDFYDPDGRFLDSKVCHYGEKLENVIVPETKEDDQYIYQFSGWDPQIPETVTESMAFTAVYQKIGKPGRPAIPDGSDACNGDTFSSVSGSEIEEDPEQIIKASSSGTVPAGKTQVSSTSYDVTSFSIETPAAPEPETSQIPTEVPSLEEPAPVTDPDPASKETAEKRKNVPEILTASDPIENPNAINAAKDPSIISAPVKSDRQTGDISWKVSGEAYVRSKTEKMPSTLSAETKARITDKTKPRHKKPAHKTMSIPAVPADQEVSADAARYSALALAPASGENARQSHLPALLSGLTVCGGTLLIKNKKIKHMR